MDKIKIEDIVLKSRTVFVKPGTKHPYVYPDGCVDLSGIRINEFRKRSLKSDESTIKEAFEYLQNPQRYAKIVIPIFPEYMPSR